MGSDSEGEEELYRVEEYPEGDPRAKSEDGIKLYKRLRFPDYLTDEWSSRVVEPGGAVVVASGEERPFLAVVHKIYRVPESSREGSEDPLIRVKVHWLYRREELELGGGRAGEQQVEEDAVEEHIRDREVFYGEEEDEIPANSLYHPCMVHFLDRKELLPRNVYGLADHNPAAVRHVVQPWPGYLCRRVYCTSSKAVYWLQDTLLPRDVHKQAQWLLQRSRAYREGVYSGRLQRALPPFSAGSRARAASSSGGTAGQQQRNGAAAQQGAVKRSSADSGGGWGNAEEGVRVAKRPRLAAQSPRTSSSSGSEPTSSSSSGSH